MTRWVNFTKLRSQLYFPSVLEDHHVKGKIRGSQFTGFCPLPTHGKRNSKPTFSANTEKGIFQCFGCGAKGNILDFAVLMAGGNPENGADVRKAALTLQERYAKTEPAPEPKNTPPRQSVPDKPIAPSLVVNAPLDFALKGLDPRHPYLNERGLSLDTITHFGLGYCSRGYLKGRIAIPLHDEQARLVGYAGRLVNADVANEKDAKYLFPPSRERKGAAYEFRKTEFLYNLHTLPTPVGDLILVEGFASVWWLHQCGFAQSAAMMGDDLAGPQAELVVAAVRPEGRVWILSDGDAAGVTCAERVLKRLAPHRFVRWVKLSDGRQPTELSPSELAKFLW